MILTFWFGFFSFSTSALDRSFADLLESMARVLSDVKLLFRITISLGCVRFSWGEPLACICSVILSASIVIVNFASGLQRFFLNSLLRSVSPLFMATTSMQSPFFDSSFSLVNSSVEGWVDWTFLWPYPKIVSCVVELGILLGDLY